MTLWDDLLTTAILGTDHRSAPGITTGGLLGQFLTELQAPGSRSREVFVLDASGTIWLHRQAGLLPAPGRPITAPICEPDELPLCSKRAAEMLSTILAEQEVSLWLLNEWLSEAVQAGVRPPYAFLPQLIDLCIDDQELLGKLSAVCPARMQWLADQNQDWRRVRRTGSSPPGDPSAWETEHFEVRRTMLSALRKENPDLARELLLSTWAEDPPEHKSAFVSELRQGLSLADEPFLEEVALNDRRKEVRAEAIKLLCLLPESRLAHRMIARLEPLLIVQPSGRDESGPSLAVNLPEQCDKSMVRDGITPKRIDDRLGEKAGWIFQMLGMVRPGYWVEKFQLPAQRLVELAEENKEWRVVLVEGWHNATITHSDPDWSEALLASNLEQDRSAMLSTMGAERRETFCLAMIQKVRGDLMSAGREQPVLDLLASMDHHWSFDFSHIVLEAIKQQLPRVPIQIKHRLVAQMPEFGLTMNPEIYPEALTMWKPDSEGFYEIEIFIEEFLSHLRFRHEMKRAIRETTTQGETTR